MHKCKLQVNKWGKSGCENFSKHAESRTYVFFLNMNINSNQMQYTVYKNFTPFKNCFPFFGCLFFFWLFCAQSQHVVFQQKHRLQNMEHF